MLPKVNVVGQGFRPRLDMCNDFGTYRRFATNKSNVTEDYFYSAIFGLPENPLASRKASASISFPPMITVRAFREPPIRRRGRFSDDTNARCQTYVRTRDPNTCHFCQYQAGSVKHTIDFILRSP